MAEKLNFFQDPKEEYTDKKLKFSNLMYLYIKK